MFEFALTHINQLWSLIGVAPALKSLAQQALSGASLASMAKQILSSDLVSVLEKSAETLFPKVAPELRIAAAVVAGYDHDKTKWLQQALNAILGTDLEVDGIYGPATVAAVEQFQQQQLGLNVDGWAYRLTNAAIQEVLAKVIAKAPDAAAAQAPVLAPSQVGI